MSNTFKKQFPGVFQRTSPNTFPIKAVRIILPINISFISTFFLTSPTRSPRCLPPSQMYSSPNNSVCIAVTDMARPTPLPYVPRAPRPTPHASRYHLTRIWHPFPLKLSLDLRDTFASKIMTGSQNLTLWLMCNHLGNDYYTRCTTNHRVLAISHSKISVVRRDPFSTNTRYCA